MKFSLLLLPLLLLLTPGLRAAPEDSPPDAPAKPAKTTKPAPVPGAQVKAVPTTEPAAAKPVTKAAKDTPVAKPAAQVANEVPATKPVVKAAKDTPVAKPAAKVANEVPATKPVVKAAKETPTAKPVAKVTSDAPPASLKKKNPALTAPVSDSKLPEDAVPEHVRGPWRVTGGAQWRQIGSLNFHGAAQAPGANLPSLNHGAKPPAVGDANAIADRTYSDGYVKKDVSGSSTTWNWGYNNGSQANGTTLTFHASGTLLSQQIVSTPSSTNWGDEASGVGGFVMFESPELFKYRMVSLSAEAGYSFTHGLSIHTGNALHVNEVSDLRSINVTDRYDTTGIVVPLAPYAGTFNGPGPIISNLPANRTVDTTGDSFHQMALVSTLRNRLSTDLHTFSFGPSAHIEIAKFRLGLSTGLALNITNWEAATHEELRAATGQLIQQWDARHSGTDFDPGFYLEATANYQLTERFSLFASGRYDWAGSLHGNAGPSSFDLGLGGWTLAAGVTYTF